MIAPPPGNKTQLVLVLEDGSERLGWGTYDTVNGRRYWSWGVDQRRAGKKVRSRLERAGVIEITGVVKAKVHQPERIEVPLGLITRRETEVILARGILTDGFNATLGGPDRIESSWDSDQHDTREEFNQAYGRHEIFAKWEPERFDRDNYLIAMGWYVRLGKRKYGYQNQKAVRWRTLGYSFESLGEKWLHVSRQRAREIYEDAIDRVWGFALEHQARSDVDPIRRLPRFYWNNSEGAPRR